MKFIKKFIANIRRKQLAARTEHEIYHKIFAHLNQRGDHGYPFSDDTGLLEALVDKSVRLRHGLLQFDEAVRKMPEAEGRALEYIAMRELNDLMEAYLKFAKERQCQSESNPRLLTAAA